MQGICVDDDATTVLQKGRKYYLFEHGPNFYVSKFDNPNAHFGSFQRQRFELIQEEKDEPQYFIGEVAYPRMGWRMGQRFIIGPTKHPELEGRNYYNVHLLNNGNIIATMQDDNLFRKIEACELPQKPAKIERKEPEHTNTLASSETAQDEPKTPQYEQLNLFDLMEG